jgi:N6-L-threonylcarbamoyladenine synthase
MPNKESENIIVPDDKRIEVYPESGPFIILGIESSCDETAAAVVRSDGTILSNIVSSQFDQHRPYGGVVPELAARAHIEHIDSIVLEAMNKSNIAFDELNGVAATGGPGLIGGVLVGTTFAKALAFGNNLPFIAINHLEGHALTARLTNNVQFPYLLLLVSGGHCQILSVTAVAKLLGLGFPGGPAIEKAALTGDKNKYKFPKPMARRPGCNFSFSGLKTAIRYTVQALNTINDQDRADLAASFQETVIAVLQDRCSNAISMFQKKYGIEKTFVISGGVAANMLIRDNLHKMATANKMKFIAPPMNLCTDNAAMIAWAGIERLKIGHTTGLDFIPRPRWPLDSFLQKKGQHI